MATKTGGEEVNADRTSNGMFFQRGENDLCKRIEERIARLIGWPMENGEGLQVLQYTPGTEYKPHYDYFDPAEPGTPTILKRGGQRVGTVIMYLGEPEKGGGTVFPDVHLEVDGRLSVAEGHAIALAALRRAQAAHPLLTLTTHLDPWPRLAREEAGEGQSAHALH